MRASTHRVFQVLMVLALAVGSALAQGSGLITGRVTDERGQSIEGVAVTLAGDGIMGVRRTLTDEEGWYRFPGITGVQPFAVKAAAAGRTPVEYRGHTVKRDGVVSIDFTLRPEGSDLILVLVEDGVPYHDMALEGARPFLPGESIVLRVTGSGSQDARRLRARMHPRPTAVLALGESAARLARRHVRDVPVVHAMVPAPADADLTTRNLCGVPLLGGFEGQIEHLRHVLPAVARIGTLYNPSRLGTAAAELRQAAAAAGIELVEAHAHGDDAAALEEGLGQLDQEPLDAFILLLDPRLVDAAGFDRISRFTARRGILLAVPDPSLAVSDGSFAFGPTFREMGILAGHLVRRVARGQAQPWQIGTVYPERGENPVVSSTGAPQPGEVLPGAPGAVTMTRIVESTRD